MMRLRYLVLPALPLAAGLFAFGCGGDKTTDGTAAAAALSGAESYARNCQGCHGAKGEGVQGVGPNVQDLKGRIPEENIRHIIRNGRDKMPAFKGMSEQELNNLVEYLWTL